MAGSYGGGCENITDRFVSGFSYMATLGAVATNGFGRLHRQDLAGECVCIRVCGSIRTRRVGGVGGGVGHRQDLAGEWVCSRVCGSVRTRRVGGVGWVGGWVGGCES